MIIEAELVERISSKSGKPYKVVVLHLPGGCEKFVFLSPAELALIELNS